MTSNERQAGSSHDVTASTQCCGLLDCLIAEPASECHRLMTVAAAAAGASGLFVQSLRRQMLHVQLNALFNCEAVKVFVQI